MNNNEIYMREAYKEALKAYKKNEVPIGCVIVKDNKIIAKAHNLRNSKKNSLYHAEVLAIDKACKKLKKVVIASSDPNPKVDGLTKLREAGIEVVEGVLEDEAKFLNRVFFCKKRKNQQFI